MRKVLLIAALLMSTSAVAHAGDSFSFQINGQRVHIERPRNCSQLSCLNISAPGLFNSSSSDDSSSPAAPTNTTAAPAAAAAPTTPAPVNQTNQAVAVTPPPVQQAPVVTTTAVAPVAPVASIPPLPGEANSANTTSNAAPLQVQASAPVQPQVQQQVVQQPPVQQQVAAVAPTAAPVAAPAANSPVGVWLTEKSEGKVHVVNCGANICGYSVDSKTGADGAEVLINMKPESDGWHGRIHDTRSGGTYDSTIAMRGGDKMRVQGCAFGGMFCGGQTWTRVN